MHVLKMFAQQNVIINSPSGIYSKLFRHTNHLRCRALHSTKKGFLPEKSGDLIEFEGVDKEEEDRIYRREFKDLKIEDYKSLYNDDMTGSVKEKIEVVLKEYEFLKYNSLGRVPSTILVTDMEQFLKEGHTPFLREKVINYLYKRELAKTSHMNKKLREREQRGEMRDQKIRSMIDKYGHVRTGLLSSAGDIIYGLWHNTLLPRIPENKLRDGTSQRRLIDAAMFGKKVIFDFDFDNEMTPWISRNASDQVVEAYGINRYQYRHPLDIWFCNFRPNDEGANYLTTKALPNMRERSMITVKEDCFTNYFDKSRLVYLSPNAHVKLEGNIAKNDDVYIIGVFNDRAGSKPLTFRKAEALGIRARSLPLDSYLAWQSGSKSLCVNHVLGILNAVMENNGDWRSALLKHIPERKVKKVDVILEQENLRLSKRKFKTKKFTLREDFFE